MDADIFDTLVKRLTQRAGDRLAEPSSAPGSRRALLRLVTALPLTGILATLWTEAGEAGGRHKRRTKRNKRRSGDDKDNRKGKRKGRGKGEDTTTVPLAPLAPSCTPTTCAAQGKNCGSIPNGCGATVECGSCRFLGQPCANNVCGTCIEDCTGKPCGADNGCGGTCPCPTGQVCAGSTCVAGQGTCPAGTNSCATGGTECNGNGNCVCYVSTEGGTRCAFNVGVGGLGVCGQCATSAECAQAFPSIPGVFCIQTAGTPCCGGSSRGLCIGPCPTR